MSFGRAPWLPAALAVVGCGGGTPLLHPAHPLPRERVSMGAGVSTQLVTGGASRRIDAARQTMTDGAVSSDDERASWVGGALAYSLLAPGLAPWVGARVGLGHSAEAGMTYTARAVRLDGRYALEGDSVAASAGLGASGVLARPSSDPPGEARGDRQERIPGLDIGGVSGFGFDVPLLVGWRSRGSVLQSWLGARGGFERLRGTAVVRIALEPSQQEDARFEAERWYALGVVGVGLTLHPVTIALELDAGYQKGSGMLTLKDGRTDGRFDGVTLAPGLAVILSLWK